MNREQLADVLRAASQLVDDRPLVMGSQAILGTYEEAVLPEAATMSMEADVAFLDDPDRAKADLVTGAIGEDSNFHQVHGFYAEGIHVETATLPVGWRDRLITQPVPAGSNGPGVLASFLERHDLVVAKLAAFREKDIRFVTELAAAGLVDIRITQARLEHTTLHPVAKDRATRLLEALGERLSKRSDQAQDVVETGASDPDADVDRVRRSERRARAAQVGQERPPSGPGIG
ncbi:DUF6036 family nucleotidyltransferase [Nocardioides sp. 31GB23]|uniref:DUF6036 family nucleotidyltransferase n=1 Tax=Nocardioides sp. 31GB23 TaxID=3156065 RepID=UPI0032AFA450